MKTIKTFIKKELSAILLLLALLGMSQGIWANGSAGGPKAVRLNVNGTDEWYNVFSTTWSYTPTCTNYTTIKSATTFSGADLGPVTTLYISGFAGLGWTDNSDWVAAKLEYQIGSGTTTSISIGGYGSGCSVEDAVCTSGNDRVCGKVGWSSTKYNILSGLTTPGDYTLNLTPYGEMRFNCGSWNPANHSTVSATFTVPGWVSSSDSHDFGTVTVGSSSSVTISLPDHYGTTNASAEIDGTNPSYFSTSSESAESITITYTPAASGGHEAVVTVTDDYNNEFTITVSGTGELPCIYGVSEAYNYELITLTSSEPAEWSVEVPTGGSGYAVSGTTSTTTFMYKGTAGNDTTGKDFVFTATSASCTDTHTVKIKKDSETCP